MTQRIIALRAVCGRAAGLVRIFNATAAFSIRGVGSGRAYLFYADGSCDSAELFRTVSGTAAKIAVGKGRIYGAAVISGGNAVLIGMGSGSLSGVLDRARAVIQAEKEKKQNEAAKAPGEPEEKQAPAQGTEARPQAPGEPAKEEEKPEQAENEAQGKEQETKTRENAANIARLSLFSQAEEEKEEDARFRAMSIFPNAFPRAFPRVNWQIVEKDDGTRLLRALFNGRTLLAYPSPAMASPPAGLPRNARYMICRNGQGYWVMEERNSR